MMSTHLVILLLLSLFLHKEASAATNRTFPPYFKFGVATASYQVEGGWNADGKGENIWDHICHNNPTFIDNQDNGDVACDSYHRYRDDVVIMKNLGVDYYRLSLSWSRIIPTGLAGSKVNQAGIDYYRNLLQELRDNNIEPMVTMYHWDLPQTLQEYGGFPNPELEHHFAYYARTVFQNLGDLVTYWATFNEPLQTCHQGYGTGTMAPGYKSSGLAEYKCAHTLIKAHARAYHIYDEEFRPQQQGYVGIVADTAWFEPASNSTEDMEAAERALQFTYGWYLNPIAHNHGNYPAVMIQRIDERSTSQGFTTSRLPKFTDEEITYIKGTHDYIAINAYTTVYAHAKAETNTSVISYESDLNIAISIDTNWEESASSWLRVVPWGIRRLLNWLKNTYNNPEIFITENGVSDTGGLNDERRINFYREYLSNVLEAHLDDGVNVVRYTAWSLMDNFEWARGYSEKFGMVSVDFNDPSRTRTAKASFLYYSQVIASRCLVDLCE